MQVAHAVSVGRVNAGAAGGCVAVVILGLLAIPGVGGFGFVVLGDFESVFLGRIAVGSVLLKIVLRKINGGGVFFGQLKFSRRGGCAQLAFECGQRFRDGVVVRTGRCRLAN